LSWSSLFSSISSSIFLFSFQPFVSIFFGHCKFFFKFYLHGNQFGTLMGCCGPLMEMKCMCNALKVLKLLLILCW
jgi:hypothetical protein